MEGLAEIQLIAGRKIKNKQEKKIDIPKNLSYISGKSFLVQLTGHVDKSKSKKRSALQGV